MLVQESGRLGNLLFQWAYALNLSKSQNRKVRVSFDKYHSDLSLLRQDLRLLETDSVTFVESNFIGNIARTADYLSNRSPFFTRVVQRYLGISNEGNLAPRTKNWLYRGFFQSYRTIEPVADLVFSKVYLKLKDVRINSKLEERFPEISGSYQVIHLRLGDFKNSEFGVLKTQSQRDLILEGIQTVICSDGDRNEVLARFGNIDALILTPEETNAWETLAVISGGSTVISSNSTLSWWGGYVANRLGATVYLPDKWRKADFGDSARLFFPGARTFNSSYE
jgi:hypothetical protein